MKKSLLVVTVFMATTLSAGVALAQSERYYPPQTITCDKNGCHGFDKRYLRVLNESPGTYTYYRGFADFSSFSNDSILQYVYADENGNGQLTVVTTYAGIHADIDQPTGWKKIGGDKSLGYKCMYQANQCPYTNVPYLLSRGSK